MSKLNLSLLEIVKIHSTNSILDDRIGENLGKSINDIIDHYIILLDSPLDTHKAVVVPEVCLTRIN